MGYEYKVELYHATEDKLSKNCSKVFESPLYRSCSITSSGKKAIFLRDQQAIGDYPYDMVIYVVRCDLFEIIIANITIALFELSNEILSHFEYKILDEDGESYELNYLFMPVLKKY